MDTDPVTSAQSRTASALKIEFTPALSGDAEVEPGIGYLQPGGLVV
ncbi:hypothetical protein [Streptomyces sp. NPDC051636]